MKKTIFLLCIFLLVLYVWSIKEHFELLPLENESPNNSSLPVKLPKDIDRVKCKESDSHQYCYNGKIRQKDIFGNYIESETYESYPHGNTYDLIDTQKVYLNDFTENELLKGSSKTRDVYFEPYTICNKNYPWHLKLPIEKTKRSVCTSTKDKEQYNKCIENETPCKDKDIDLQPTEIYNEYNCSDHSKVVKSLEGTNARISTPGSSYNGNFNIIVIRSPTKNDWINLREMQLWINNENVLPKHISTSMQSGSLTNIHTEFIDWSSKRLLPSYRNGSIWKASNIANRDIPNNLNVHSGNTSSSLYIPLSNVFNLQMIQSLVLYNRVDCCTDRINGFQIEFYFVDLKSPIFTIGVNTTQAIYRWDFPSINTYSLGFSNEDSVNQIHSTNPIPINNPYSGKPQVVSKSIEIGTYHDTWRRGLNVYKGRTNSSGQSYNIETCAKECNNYNYFALQDGSRGNPQCFCGNSLENATQYGPKVCDKNSGGPWCNSIYKNVCSFISDTTIETSTLCTIHNGQMIYDENKVSDLCKEKSCLTEQYLDISQCYSNESEASYQHDNYYYNVNNKTKYPFEVEPKNPNDYIITNNHLVNKVKIKSPKIDYSVSLCSPEKPLYANNSCHTLEDNVVDISCNKDYPYVWNGLCVNYDTYMKNMNSSCTKEKPYKYNNNCYDTIEYAESTEFILDYSQNDVCFLKDNPIGISCEDLYGVSDLDTNMLYNPITNNYIGQLNHGDYKTNDCSGMLTQCMNKFPYEKNDQGEYVMPMTNDYTIQKDNIPEYPTPLPYKEPPISKYIKPYNSNLQSNLWIQCKHDYSKIPQENMCPKELPICEGSVKDTQLGVCKDSLDSTTDTLTSYNVNQLSCKHDYGTIPKPDMCPYNLPYCEDSVCKESSLFYNR